MWSLRKYSLGVIHVMPLELNYTTGCPFLGEGRRKKVGGGWFDREDQVFYPLAASQRRGVYATSQASG